MLNFAVTWKPPITHLTDWDADGTPKTLCGVLIPDEWQGSGDTMPYEYLIDGIACGCLKCQKIAIAAATGETK